MSRINDPVERVARIIARREDPDREWDDRYPIWQNTYRRTARIIIDDLAYDFSDIADDDVSPAEREADRIRSHAHYAEDET